MSVKFLGIKVSSGCSVSWRHDKVKHLKQARPGDLVITMGAGDIWKVGEEYLKEAPADEYATACGAAKGSAQINNPQANDERLSVVQTNETH